MTSKPPVIVHIAIITQPVIVHTMSTMIRQISRTGELVVGTLSGVRPVQAGGGPGVSLGPGQRRQKGR